MILTTVLLALAVIIVIVVLYAIVKTCYVVVEPNKAHVVVVRGKGRKIYHPSQDGSPSSYFYFPLFMRRIIVSLENVKQEINDIELRDTNFAPFTCDIVCWFKISNPELAAEKLAVSADGDIMNSIQETLSAQVQGVTRAAAMKQEILDLMRDRTTFGVSIFKEVNGDLDEWGVQLVKLEIIDFADLKDSHVIKDYEARREAEISSTTRQTVANQTQLAEVKEAEATNTANQARITADQEIKMRGIERDQTVSTREQLARLTIAKQTETANVQEVSAEKAKVLGEAQYNADATVITADGQAKAKVKLSEGEKNAEIMTATGNAQAIKLNADAQSEQINKTGTAEALVIEKKAEAQKKFQDASKEIEMAKIAADLQKTMYIEFSKALAAANLQIISPDMKFMGFGAEEGAGLGAMIKNLQKTSGVDLRALVSKVTGGSGSNAGTSKDAPKATK